MDFTAQLCWLWQEKCSILYLAAPCSVSTSRPFPLALCCVTFLLCTSFVITPLLTAFFGLLRFMFVSWLEAEQVAQIAWQLFAAGYPAHNLLFASTREKKGDRGQGMFSDTILPISFTETCWQTLYSLQYINGEMIYYR